MHTSSSILPQNAPSGVYHLEEKSEWLTRISQKTAAFYTYGFLMRWLRSFPKPSVLLVADQTIDVTPWEKRFKTSALKQLTFQQALEAGTGHAEPVSMLVIFQEDASVEAVLQLSPLLKRSGAFIWITQNRSHDWKQIQAGLEEHQISQLHCLGFHPKGAVAWWPFDNAPAVVIGKVVDILATFFFGRNQTARRFGRYWLIRGLKEENDTQLT